MHPSTAKILKWRKAHPERFKAQQARILARRRIYAKVGKAYIAEDQAALDAAVAELDAFNATPTPAQVRAAAK